MKKLFLFVTLALLSLVDSAFGGAIDAELAKKWYMDGSQVIFGNDETYKNTKDGASGYYSVGQALSGGKDSKSGVISLTIKKATDTSWPAASYSKCPVQWQRQDLMETRTKIKKYKVKDPNDDTKWIEIEEPVSEDVRIGDAFVLTVTCDPGKLTLTREEKDPKLAAK